MSGPRSKKRQEIPLCLLCKAPIEESTAPGLWLHSESVVCSVRITDKYGVSLDDRYEVIDNEIYEKETIDTSTPLEYPLIRSKSVLSSNESLNFSVIDGKMHLPVISGGISTSNFNFSLSIPNFKSHEESITDLFKQHKVEKLGGASGDLGWSSFYSFQRCPYLWSRNYLEGARFNSEYTPIPLIVGSLLHLLLALRYQVRIDLTYPINPELALNHLKQDGVNPDAIREAQRLYETYQLIYQGEEKYLIPLAVEHHTADPRTKESCRYDMIATINGDQSPFFIDAEKTDDVQAPQMIDVPSGTYIVETKTTSRRDENSLTGWINDGEIIGQVTLYNRLKLYRKFGPLQGVIINLLGKQKNPSMDRVFVSVNRDHCRQHSKDLKFWQAFRQLCLAQDSFPRARANCINRWGKCSQWKHCTGQEGSE